jgi:hypothetical protein
MTNSIEQLIETLSRLSTTLQAHATTLQAHATTLLTDATTLLTNATPLMAAVDPAHHAPILAGSGALVLLLMASLVARIRKARINARASETFGREVTFEDISSEAANANGTQAPVMPDIKAQVADYTSEHKDDEAAVFADNAEAQPTGFTFFKRNSKSSDANVGATQPASKDAGAGITAVGEAAPAAAQGNLTANLEDDAFLAVLEQEMLATRQLYLDGVISKEVYVSETRALYSKAQSRMT